MTDEQSPVVQWRAALAALGERAAPGPECPEPDRLWATATAELPMTERHEIVAHLASCASCAAAFRLARGLSREGPVPAADAGPSLLSVPHQWLRWAVPLTALAAVLALAVLVPRPWQSRPEVYRGGEPMEIRSLMDEGTVLPRDQAVLRWTAGPPGSLYEVRLLTREGREVAVEAGLESPQYRIPPPALAGLGSGTVLYWQVKVQQPDGTSAMSKTFSVRLR